MFPSALSGLAVFAACIVSIDKKALEDNRAELEVAKAAQASAEESVTSLQRKNAALSKRLSEGLSRHEMLSEGLSGKDRQIKSLQEQVTTLNEAHSKKCAELEAKATRLNEELQESKKDSQIVRSQASAKIAQATQLTEKYKSIAKTAVDRYISSQPASNDIPDHNLSTRHANSRESHLPSSRR